MVPLLLTVVPFNEIFPDTPVVNVMFAVPDDVIDTKLDEDTVNPVRVPTEVKLEEVTALLSVLPDK